jgi:hypothetical protein
MYISYSGFDLWEKCPSSYWHRYINKTVSPEPDNRINMLYGGSVGVSFEHFYNDRMWRQPNYLETMLAKVPGIVRKIVDEETAPGKNGYINWSDKKSIYKSPEEVIADVREAIPRGLKIIRQHRLVGPEMIAELKLDSKKHGHILGGRCDIYVHRTAPDNDRCILDGKGSKFRDTYVNKRQLRWYSMLFEDHRGYIPDRVGFLYWRSDPETAVDWHPITRDDTAGLRELVLQTCETIEDRRRRLPMVPAPSREQLMEQFPTQPSQDCRWCNYLSACDEGKRFEANRGKAPKPDFSEGSSESGVEDVGI